MTGNNTESVIFRQPEHEQNLILSSSAVQLVKDLKQHQAPLPQLT